MTNNPVRLGLKKSFGFGEALRVAARTNAKLFAEIVEFCRGRFDTDRASYHISATVDQMRSLPPYSGQKNEPGFLDEVAGRQLLHVTFGSMLANPNFKPRILDTLRKHADLLREVIDCHLTKHLSLLTKG